MEDFYLVLDRLHLTKGVCKLRLIEQTLREMFHILLYSFFQLADVEGGNDDF